MFNNISNNNKFPKTLQIRNTSGGMIWQIYHINNLNEAKILSKNANKNGFYCRTLIDYEPQLETFPDWRIKCSDELKKVLTVLK